MDENLAAQIPHCELARHLGCESLGHVRDIVQRHGQQKQRHQPVQPLHIALQDVVIHAALGQAGSKLGREGLECDQRHRPGNAEFVRAQVAEQAQHKAEVEGALLSLLLRRLDGAHSDSSSAVSLWRS